MDTDRSYENRLPEFASKQELVPETLDRRTRELQDYVENATIGLHWVDQNGIIKWANKAELAMLGYTKEEYIGHPIAEFHADEHKINDILHRLSCNETLVGYEATLRCKDGSLKTVHISSNVYREDGEFIHTRCFTIDVSEEKRLFTALQDSEKRYRDVINSLATPLYTTDAQGRIALYNQAASELWGREPVIGTDLWCGSYRIRKVDGAELPLSECPMAVCLREQRPVYDQEILVVRPDGTIRHVAPRPQPLFDAHGKVTGAINMLLDITDIRKTEKALRDSERNYRLLAESLEKKVAERTRDLEASNLELKKSEERYHKMVDEVEDYAIIMLDKNGVVQNWNKGAEKIKGYKEHEIIGKSFAVFYLDEDRETNVPSNLLKAARTSGKCVHEGWRRRKDGSRFWASTVLTALHDHNNEVVGFTKVTRDLTEKKIAEDQLREYSNQLEFQNRELEQFAYAASHDMKEPLRKIHLYNSMIAENPANVLDDKSRHYLNRSLAAVTRMSQLIDDLLAYSRSVASPETREEIDLNKLIDEIVSVHKDDFGLHDISIRYDGLPVISGIRFQVKQLFDNLISNSIKYRHPERKLFIRISSDQITGTPTNGLVNNRLYYKISVEDNGIGFEQQYAHKIFDLFQRMHNVPGINGSGVGLTMCKRIVQNYEGIIRAYGETNKGASFDCYLPATSVFSSKMVTY